jgi:predicted nucleic acid-binding protein
VRYLADVNVLVALAWQAHACHDQVENWIRSLQSLPDSVLLTCAITELGFLRVSLQIPGYSLDIITAQRALSSMKSARRLRHEFVPDAISGSSLPAWAKTPRHLTDAHLAQIAASAQAQLATLDRGIPGAFVIP